MASKGGKRIKFEVNAEVPPAPADETTLVVHLESEKPATVVTREGHLDGCDCSSDDEYYPDSAYCQKSKASRDDDESSELWSGDDLYGPAYPNDSAEHTIDHVRDLDNSILRVQHWQDCVLTPDPRVRARALKLARAEKLDCLATIYMCSSIRDYGSGMSEASLQALKDGVCSQLPVTWDEWDQRIRRKEVDELLTECPDANYLPLLCKKVPAYKTEAQRRLQAVLHLTSKIPAEEATKIKEHDAFFSLIRKNLRQRTNDPRTKLLDQVALFHWCLKVDVVELPTIPLI